MYNIFQYANAYRERKHNNHRQKLQAQFYAKHQQFKRNSHAKLQSRAEEFLIAQKRSTNDTFYFRNSVSNIQKSPSFINTTKSKILEFDQINNDFENNRRNTKNQSYYLQNSQRNSLDTNSKLISGHSQSPSRRSNPVELNKISIKAYDNNVHNKQPLKPTTQFDHQFHKLYKSFQSSKSKLLKMRNDTLNKYENRLYNEIRKYKEDNHMKQTKIPKFSINPQIQEQSGETSYNKDKAKQKRQNKIYFKLAKTMQMFHPDVRMRNQFEDILKQSNYSVDKRTKRYSSSLNK